MNLSYDSTTIKNPVLSELKEIYRYRYFLSNLISRDLSVRYKRTFFGFLWSFLNPLLMMIVLSLAFSNLFGRSETRSTYILSGILIFGLFNQGVNASMRSLIANVNIINSIYVPTSIFIFSAVVSEFINYCFSIIVLFIIGSFLGSPITLSWIYLPLISFLLLLFTLGTGLIISSFVLFFLDIRDFWQILMRAFYFLTPVMFTVELYPKSIAEFQNYNPISIYMIQFRAAYYGTMINPGDILIMTIIGVGTLIAGWILFTKLSKWIPYYL